jgi:nucleoside triphosphate diphosphatase
MGRSGTETERLERIMARLRAEGGCPWDRAQDLRSLRPYLVEETYEVLDEMDRVAEGGSWTSLCEELGDLLFQIVFHAQLASEIGEFELADVAQAISDKIVRRHPHVFSDTRVSGAEEVLQNWARLKAEERKKKHGSEGSVLDGVPSAAPALLRAERLTEKASRIGFDWPDVQGVLRKLEEELGELEEAMASASKPAIEHELGDVLFSLANLARFLATPAEDALRAANRRFTERFHAVEAGLRKQGVPFGEATLLQMDALWEAAKAEEAALPRPASTPVAALTTLQLPVAPGAVAFWQRVGPLLGWAVRVEGTAVRCQTPGVALLLVPGTVGTAAELEASFAVDVSALVKAVEEAGGILHARERGQCVFSDPGGSVVVRSRTSAHDSTTLPTGPV